MKWKRLKIASDLDPEEVRKNSENTCVKKCV